MLTKRQKEVLDFIKSYSKRKEYAPSLEEIQKRFKFASVSTSHFHVTRLKESGYLDKTENRARAISLSTNEKLKTIPLLGTIAAGEPIEAVEEAETIVIPASKTPSGERVYALRVSGNSMIEENINDGDVILVQHQATAENGQKVVALLENYGATLKKFYKEKGRIRLQPANKKLEPIIVRRDKDIAIQGIVLDVLKNDRTQLSQTLFQQSFSYPPKDSLSRKKFESEEVGLSTLIHGSSFEWLDSAALHSIDAIVTDPPYGVVEFDSDQLMKRKNGKGGIWRIPPSFDGHTRAPLPRFTALDARDRSRIYNFFRTWAEKTVRVLKPGGHLFIATNAFIAPLLYRALEDGGLEFRGQMIRAVRTLRGGDRPKNAEHEFSEVCSLPRGCYEPWGIFRNKLPSGMRVQDCLRQFGTGGLRRLPNGNPFEDFIPSERTTQKEKNIADHPSLKPQAFLRKLVYASLPLGKGVILDPFMGSGSTLAAANASKLESIGIEINQEYFEMAKKAVPKLALI